MSFEDLMIDKSQTVAEEAAFLKNKLISVRTANRQEIVNRFDMDEHRLEHVTQFRGVNFINDSKACTSNATYYSFETLKSNIVWIAGGDDSLLNYTEIAGHVFNKVKALVCIGNNNQKLRESFFDYIQEIHEHKNMEDAVRAAFYAAERGDTVLLSAGCECDELYSDYEERGTAFRKAIAQL